MSSRSPSPPYRGRRGGDAEQSSMERSYLHSRRRPRPRPTPYSPERRVASSVPRDRPCSPPSYTSVVRRGLGTPPPEPQHGQESGSAADRASPEFHYSKATKLQKFTVKVSRDYEITENQKPGSRTSPPCLLSSMNLDLADVPREGCSFSPTLPDASIAGCSAHAPLQLQHQEESESGSELDSPPYITFMAREKYEEPSSPTSPSASPTSPHVPRKTPSVSLPLVDMNPTGSPNYSSSDEEDAYFKSMVDNFVTAAANTFIYTSSDDDIDYKAADQRHSVMYAEHALKHYNNDEKNEVKYELINGITSCDALIREGCFGHVNFTAKGNRHNSKEELFFAELRWDGDTPVPTCVVSLEGMKYTGGLRGSRYDKFYVGVLPKDEQNCYCCCHQLKHPKNGELYKMGHIATSDYYEM